MSVCGFGFFIDKKINKELRKRVHYFLANSDGTNWPNQLQLLFDFLFLTKIWSRPSFSRSVIASCIVLIVSTTCWLIYDASNLDMFVTYMTDEPLFHLFVLAPYAICINAIGDFFSLWQTRIIVARMANSISGMYRISLLLLDVLFSAIIFSIGLALGTVAFLLTWVLAGGSLTFFGEGTWISIVHSAITGNFSEFVHDGGMFLSADTLYENFLGLFFLTTFFTSIWTWAFLSGVVIFPMLRRLWDVINVENYPIGAVFTVGGMVLGVATTIGGYL